MIYISKSYNDQGLKYDPQTIISCQIPFRRPFQGNSLLCAGLFSHFDMFFKIAGDERAGWAIWAMQGGSTAIIVVRLATFNALRMAET